MNKKMLLSSFLWLTLSIFSFLFICSLSYIKNSYLSSVVNISPLIYMKVLVIICSIILIFISLKYSKTRKYFLWLLYGFFILLVLLLNFRIFSYLLIFQSFVLFGYIILTINLSNTLRYFLKI